MSALPPGPAFIPWRVKSQPLTPEKLMWLLDIPDGYIWTPATDHTMAGWVRPSGSVASGLQSR